ncbi:MAG TPA: phytanoyl-CoA dioxygenase family protein [Caulobacteraceae bacterium]|jgi:ectoine hydroxylase-related dioxygenase (phytanoyl-CoA dioxygenase family)|nr:phytanoyl-CoA dioxygenase family protein [Caulobacteraceae bacterium]
MSSVAQPAFELHRLNVDFTWRETRRRDLRRLTAADAKQFDDDGYVVIHDVFSSEEIARLRRIIDPLEAANAARVETQHDGRDGITESGAISFTAHLVATSPELAAFARHPAIRDLCDDLIGGAVRLYWDQAVYKKPEKPRDFPWHQDNGYTFVEPQAYLTLWIPLVDVDETNGCPWIAPGVHRAGTLRHRWTDLGFVCFEAPARQVAAPARAGDVVVFSSLTPHRTGPNLRPGHVRKAYILQYAPDGVVAHQRDGRVALQNDAARQFRIC